MDLGPQKLLRATAMAQIAALDSRCERIAQSILGQQMVWRTVGQGPHLVLLHGGHGNWLHWARVIPALSERFTLWMPDMPGFGESSLCPAPSSPQGLNELVSQLRHSLDELLGASTPIRLAGFSFGGLVAALLAAERTHIKRMVLVGPAGHGGQRRQNTLPLSWRDLDPERVPAQWSERMRHNLLAQMLHSETAVDALAMEIQWRGCMHTRFRSKPFSRSAALMPALRCYAGEGLILWGEHDVTATPSNMPDYFAPDGVARKRQIIGGAGHWLMHEAPEVTAALLKGMLCPAIPDWV